MRAYERSELEDVIVMLRDGIITVSVENLLSRWRDDETVDDMVDRLTRDLYLPPITVRRQGDKYYVVDGNHRVEAHRRAGRKTIRARLTL